ncbi:glycoside hydrolase family 5 protein [Altericista sp. CCNU0014]|uniref:glycoside hydrolase family 5 protein n=1 Tax=Altericista sp. CCNU0014 TaxID=3082949 RepID=UPI00384B39F6
MDRRNFLTWAGVGCVASSLFKTSTALSLEPIEAQELIEKAIKKVIKGVISNNRKATFYTQGRYLYDKLGNKVILRGVNKMSVWDEKDPIGDISFPEIRKTGANSVRLPWVIRKDLKPGISDSDPKILDALITNAKNNHLIPIVDLHDSTGIWNRLQDVVDYWVQPTIVSIIQKHQEYLLVNIANETGDEHVKEEQFIAGYTNAIQTMRSAGIRTPLVIDASDWGKNLDILDATASTLLNADPDNNLLFSVHLYWPISYGADANFIRSKLQNSVNLGYPLIVGEFSEFGAWAGKNVSICSPGGKIDYQTILEECHKHEIGWYAWEWGPGNDFKDPLCSVMDMTPDRLFDNLKPGWATEVAIDSPYSIKNTSVIPPTL